MSSNWFDFDDDSDFFDKSKVEFIKKNFGVSSTKKWSSGRSEVNEILDVTASKLGTRGKTKFLNSLLKDKFLGGRQGALDDDFFSEVDARVKNIRSQVGESRKLEKTGSCSSSNSYGFADVTGERCRKNSADSTWSRKSVPVGNVSFPTSSASTISEVFPEKIGRSISRESDDSMCTEKSVNCSMVSEKLSDGTDKTQTENEESWLRKSGSGSKISEGKVNDVTLTEKNEDNLCEKTTTKMSYLEKSATGSSLQEEVTSERLTSSSKGTSKTMEQNTSSETYKKSLHSTPNKSIYYDHLDSCSFLPSSFSKACGEDKSRRRDVFRPRTSLVSEKISKLIDEAVHQDDLFKIPLSLQTDIDRMTDDFFNSKTFGEDRTRATRKRLADLFPKTGQEKSYMTCLKLSELKTENESLQEENLKLQSIIQDVTAVNKRWQKYNNERRLYVQKLLSTIQDLQEQINLISEKSAFQSKGQGEASGTREEADRLRKEHLEHVAVLELQIKSHKDDWEAERKEKRKALEDKEELEARVQELARDLKFLKNVLQEEKERKVCAMCHTKFDDEHIFQTVDFCPPLQVSGVPSGSNFRNPVHVAYETSEISGEGCYCSKEEGKMGGQESGACFQGARPQAIEPYSSDRFSRTSKSIKAMSGDTIVVEDESGIRLSITEQFPSKDSNLKSILKKNEKKNKGGKSFFGGGEEKESKASRMRRPSSDKPNITCEEFAPTETLTYGLSMGFREAGLAQVTSFSPDSIAASSGGQYLSAGATSQLLAVEVPDSRSKSEPNTRSNSSENLKPLRESSSWNNESLVADAGVPRENVLCPDCDRVFPPSMHLQFLDHYEVCQTRNNHF